jgi:hypothetical protein
MQREWEVRDGYNGDVFRVFNEAPHHEDVSQERIPWIVTPSRGSASRWNA